jgi:hypothetical protein
MHKKRAEQLILTIKSYFGIKMHYKSLLLLFLSTGCFANETSFKQSVLRGYFERCQEVRAGAYFGCFLFI